MSQISVIVAEIKNWLDTTQKRDEYQKCKFEYLVSMQNVFRAIIVFPNCIGELMVNEADSAPYRFVKFEAVAYVSNLPHMITSWYDQDGDTNEYIMAELDKAFKAAFAFE